MKPCGVQDQQGCFEEAGSAQVVDPLIVVLAMGPEVASHPYELSASLIGLGPATSTMHQRTKEKPCPLRTHITSWNLVSAMFSVTQLQPPSAIFWETVEVKLWNLI